MINNDKKKFDLSVIIKINEPEDLRKILNLNPVKAFVTADDFKTGFVFEKDGLKYGVTIETWNRILWNSGILNE